MGEATPTITKTSAPNHAQRSVMTRAVRVLAQQRAIKEVKAAIQREGKVKLSQVLHRDIVSMAEARVIADVPYRERLIADAKRVVEQWHADGVFGPRGGIQR